MDTSFQLLQVRARVITPIAPTTYPIHLDGLLAAGLLRELLDQGIGFDDAVGMIRSGEAPLPLRFSNGVAMASQFAFCQPSLMQQAIHTSKRDYTEIIKAGDVVALPRKVRFTPGTGSYKHYLIPVPLQSISGVIGYCVGDPDRIAELLSRITHFGKIKRNDWGRLGEWEILPDDSAHEKWRVRSIPLAEESLKLPGHRKAVGQARLPYWDRTHAEVVFAHPLEIVREVW